jgi:hypothetical protein
VKVVHRTSALAVDTLELRIANRNRRPLSRLAGVCLVGILLVASGCSSEAPTAASETPVARGIAAAPSSTPATTNSSSPQTVSPQTTSPETMSTQAAGALIASAGPATALAALGALVVKDSAESTGYQLAEFGTQWADTNNNNCNTWNDILARDLKDVTVDAACTITSGLLLDPFTAKTVAYTSSAAASTVAVDAVVALKAAWAQGASSWDAVKRQIFANDPFNLLTVDSKVAGLRLAANATWMPPDESFQCSFVARRIAVEAKYALTITGVEKGADAVVLSTCPQQTMPEDTAAIKAQADKQAADAAAAVAAQAAADKAVADKAAADKQAADQAAVDQASADKIAADKAAADQAAAAAADQAAADKVAADKAAADQAAADQAAAARAAVPAAPAGGGGAHFANCTEVKAAGAAPIYRSEPGYSGSLDRDGDGVACEK